MRRRFVIGFAIAVVLGPLLVGGVALWWGYSQFTAPSALAEKTTVVIERGASVRAIGERLAEAGVLDKPWLFALGVRAFADGRPMQAGEYLLPPGVSPRQAMEQMIEGRKLQRRVTLAEGLTNREILEVLAATPGLAGDLPALEDLGPEGALLPETYFYVLGDDPNAILERMEDAMVAAIAELWPARAEGLPLETPEQAVILASIVERETGLASERKRVAAVFINRLNKGMPLQSDPTVIYALTEGREALGRSLTYGDLEIEHPFNTYYIPGLPPAPIANPGRAALEAVLHPADSDDLYFVADGTGGHAFAKTLSEHNANVAAWRKIQAEQGD